MKKELETDSLALIGAVCFILAAEGYAFEYEPQPGRPLNHRLVFQRDEKSIDLVSRAARAAHPEVNWVL